MQNTSSLKLRGATPAAVAPTSQPTVVSARAGDHVSANGMRYTHKAAGSRFSTPLGSNAGQALSCFFCGTHRVSAERTTQRMLGKNHQVCSPACARNPRSKTATGAAGGATQ